MKQQPAETLRYAWPRHIRSLLWLKDERLRESMYFLSRTADTVQPAYFELAIVAVRRREPYILVATWKIDHIIKYRIGVNSELPECSHDSSM